MINRAVISDQKCLAYFERGIATGIILSPEVSFSMPLFTDLAKVHNYPCRKRFGKELIDLLYKKSRSFLMHLIKGYRAYTLFFGLFIG